MNVHNPADAAAGRANADIGNDIAQISSELTAQHRQLRHQYAARACVQQYTLLQSIVHRQPRWTQTSQQQQSQKWIQDVSAYEMTHPVIDDALKVSTVINNVDLYSNNTTSGSTTSHMARSTTDGGHLLCQQLHAPPWSDHRQHRPGHQLHQEQEGQR